MSDQKLTALQKLPIEKKIGQMIIAGFRGYNPAGCKAVSQQIESGYIGGLIFFDRDVALGSDKRNIISPDQIKELTAYFQSIAEIPLFTAIDQEGGKVARLKPARGFPETLSQLQLGEKDDPSFTEQYADKQSQMLHSLGFNLNFAPVVDLNLYQNNPVIGKLERSFSDDPDIVARNAALVIRRQKQHNIISSLKHFPGHGSSHGDSHLGFVDVTELWQPFELEPFEILIKNELADMIMTAHIFNKKWDKIYPATLSKEVLQGMLREELNFTGVIVSDDMNMKAISEQWALEDAVCKAINAGIDILVFGNNLVYNPDIATQAAEIIINLVGQRKISEDRINESFNRIITLKSKFGLLS